jgi:hypothetical protein
MGVMRVGIGLPAAVPEADMTQIGRWAAEAESAYPCSGDLEQVALLAQALSKRRNA